MKAIKLPARAGPSTTTIGAACDVLVSAVRAGGGALVRFHDPGAGVVVVVAVDDAAAPVAQAFDVIKGARDAMRAEQVDEV